MTGQAVPVPETPEVPVVPPPQGRPPKVRTRPTAALLEPSILRRAVLEAFVKLDPRTMIRNPVMFVVEIGSVITTVVFFGRPGLFVGLVTLWLWATVLFANFAEAVAEGRGKAQADTLRRGRGKPWPACSGRTAAPRRSRRPSCGPATSPSSRPGRSFPATATWWRGWRSSTSRPSRVSPPR